MSTRKKKVVVVNLLCWVAAALLYPMANLLLAVSGETIFSLLIPIVLFIGLAFGTTVMMALNLAEPGAPADGCGT